jgi:hypothetical protein
MLRRRSEPAVETWEQMGTLSVISASGIKSVSHYLRALTPAFPAN